MQCETVLRIRYQGGLAGACAESAKIFALIDATFRIVEPAYHSVEVVTTDGVATFTKGEYKTITPQLVHSVLSERLYYMNTGRVRKLGYRRFAR